MGRDDQRKARVSDEELEYYGQLYMQQNLREVVEFETFLLDPERYLRRKPRETASPDGQPPGRRGILGILRPRPSPNS